MGRLVRKPAVPEPDQQIEALEGVLASSMPGFALAARRAGDNYLERFVKYIPAEIIGGSMLINAMLQQAVIAGGTQASMAGLYVTSIAKIALVAGCLLTPVFCWYVREDGDAWIVNAIVSTIAFPFWAYLMGAVAFADYHDGNLAVILVLFVSVMAGLVAPGPDRRRDELTRARPRANIVEAFAKAFLPEEGLDIDEALQTSDSSYQVPAHAEPASHLDVRFGPRRAHGIP